MKPDTKRTGLLRFLHGETYTWQDIAITYATAMVVTGIVIPTLFPDHLATWQTVLLTCLLLDVSGGIVSNATTSTRHFYARPAGRRILFLLLHAAHPLLMLLLFPDCPTFIILTGTAILAASLLVNAIRASRYALPAASAILAILITTLLAYAPEEPSLPLLMALLSVKLILCFSTGGLPQKTQSHEPVSRT
jgi:hypothetical protein